MAGIQIAALELGNLKSGGTTPITVRLSPFSVIVRPTLESQAAGLVDPASLHPVVILNKCIGCASCIAACPEMPAHQVLGMVRHKVRLVSPTDCIGHGACQTACPVDAITLVFGTERRGVDIPNVEPNFETNIPGIFIARELGGMGLIRNAIEQGDKPWSVSLRSSAKRALTLWTLSSLAPDPRVFRRRWQPSNTS